MPEFYLADGFALGELARARSADPLLAWAYELAAEAQPEDVYRNKEGRKTLRFQYRGKPYFLKLHTGVGWIEVLKPLVVGDHNAARNSAIAAALTFNAELLTLSDGLRSNRQRGQDQHRLVGVTDHVLSPCELHSGFA